ncbi:RhoGEF domain-containing protein [Cavenderia fasciculata]|uniref:RhoGEF domain-containing protein n=1 Tax=Cavenderia fasciculata TaxID=261658 RepID=F4PSC8_CACFS|nr:RhoGEF domain-containing protein [Cavenderia fasciculata]EGG20674.1 RhoGEF domain-containing protein [Cavenderia fasciculata]|eukprot:XP_004358524.1 RhoGEF domain-containing protein [Cavenderia fasciculata]
MYVAYFLNHQKAASILGNSGVSVSSHHRGHTRTSSTGSNTSTSSVDGMLPRGGGNVPVPPNSTILNSSSERHIKRAPAKRTSESTTSTPDKAANNVIITPTSSPMVHDRHQHITNNNNNKQNNATPDNSNLIDKAALMEILQNFTTELKRITTEHEEMLNKTAAKLDERVNRLGDKLDQLEIKIGVIKNVVVSVSSNENSNLIGGVVVSGGGGVTVITDTTDDQPTSTSTTTTSSPALVSTTSTTSTTSLATVLEQEGGSKKDKRKSKKQESREERDERREKRRSRRKEREDKKRVMHGTIDSSAASTMTLSSSSCSLADDAQVDRDDLKKIIKVQSLARAFLARKAYRRIKTRRGVAQEMLNSEKTYIHNLHILLHDYLVPLRKMCEGNSAINPDNVKSLYNNIEVILNINNSLLKRVQERMSTPWHYEQLFGDIFFKMCDLLKCYIAYVNLYNRSLTTVNEFGKTSTFADFLNSTFQRTNQQLRDLIIIPVQRIPRYVLLLEEMVKVTPASHPDHSQLVGSLAKMHTIADHVNEKRREFENVSQVALLQDSIIGFNIMEYPSLRYIMEGDLQLHMSSSGSGFGVVTGTLSNAVTGSSSDLKSTGGVMALQNLHVFLFNQMLVVCKYKKGKESYFSKFGSSSSSSDRKSKQPKYKFIFCYNLTSETKLSHNKSESWFGVDNSSEYKRFIAQGVTTKDMWIQHIQSCITKMAENKKSKNIQT